MDVLLKIVQAINTYLSNYILIILLVGVGLYFSIRTRFVQVRCFGEGMKNVFGNIKLKGGKKKGNLMAAEEFAALKETVVETVLRASEELRSGKADAAPCEEKACEYCKMKAVCRIKRK